MINRRRKNRIRAVFDKGVWIKKQRDIKDYFLEKFGEVFKTDNSVMPTSLENLEFLPITLEANADFMRIPFEIEIEASILALHPLKALGPNGFPIFFYRHYWKTVKSQIVCCTQECFRTGAIPKGLNRSYIVLIPKLQQATKFNQYRPISLCNFTYKIVYKIITMRLKPLLANLISSNQGEFVESR